MEKSEEELQQLFNKSEELLIIIQVLTVIIKPHDKVYLSWGCDPHNYKNDRSARRNLLGCSASKDSKREYLRYLLGY